MTGTTNPPLTASPYRLIGRVDELELVVEQLTHTDARLVTVTGVGGIGKTRLALEVARSVARHFRDGARFVELATCREPGIVLSTIQQAVTSGEPDGRRHGLEAVKRALQSLELLLVLDNFEQVLEAGPLISELLAMCHGLRVLVTSRAPLRLRWERELALGPLAIPELCDGGEEVLATSSVALLVECLRRYGFARRHANEDIAALAEICRRVDGIPLAIELAAARARLLGLPGLVKHLEHPLELLTDGARDSPGRHRTLRATFDWSYELLLDSDKRVFRHMGVFIGGCTYATAARVCGTNVDDIEFLNALERVVESGFVRRIDSHDMRGPRLQLLEPVREYALERLTQSGEDDVAYRLHASTYLELAELAARDLPSSPGTNWLAVLTEEHGNALAALRWLVTSKQVTYSLRLVAALSKFWWVQGLVREAMDHAQEVLALAECAQPDDALNRARAAVYIERGAGKFYMGDYQGAEASALAGLALFGDDGNLAFRAYGVTVLGNSALALGNAERANSHFEDALQMYRAAAVASGIAETLMHLGRVAWIRQEYDRARELLSECVPGLHASRDLWSAAFALRTLALVECHCGDFSAARTHLRESIVIWREVGGRVLLAQLLETSAIIAAASGQHERAVRIAGAAAAQRSELVTPPTPTWQREIDRWLERAYTGLGAQASATAWAEGQALGLAAAVAEADSTDVGPRLSQPGLTARELEVLRLVANGHTNKEIAAHVHISIATVERHLANLYGKIGARNRSDATAYAITRGLLTP